MLQRQARFIKGVKCGIVSAERGDLVDHGRNRLRQLKSALDGLFDNSECLVGQSAQGRVTQKGLFERGHLIARGPGIAAESRLARLEWDPQRKPWAFHAGDGHNANIEGVAI